MNLYVAVVESDKRPGRCVKMIIHVPTRKEAEAIARRRLRKWTLRSLNLKRGRACVLFQDELPEE
jgi:hypothetical protein